MPTSTSFRLPLTSRTTNRRAAVEWMLWVMAAGAVASVLVVALIAYLIRDDEPF